MIPNPSIEICTNQLSSISLNEKWTWDESRKELVYQNENTNYKKKNIINEKFKIDLRTDLITYRKQNRTFQCIKKTKINNKITLNDVIEASLNVMSESFYIPIKFEEYIRMTSVQEYLLYLLNYFYWFLQTINNAVPELNRQIDRSEREKTCIRISYAHLLAAFHELNCKYARLLLGIDLKDFHHMRNGDLFYSCTNLDRTIYESLFIFSIYFIWITFYRENFDRIRMELIRLFRANVDIELLRIPLNEVHKIKSETSIESRKQYELIDCKELTSQSMMKKVSIKTMNEISSPKFSIEHKNSIIWNNNKISNHSKQQRWRNFLTKNSHDNNEIDEFKERSSLYRRKHQWIISQRENRIRGILTKQLKCRNQSLIDNKNDRFKKNLSIRTNENGMKNKISDRIKIKQERLLVKQLLKPSSYKNITLLPAPDNPLDDHRIIKKKQLSLPDIEYKLQENLGIIGQPYINFDLIRLTLKPHDENSIIIPREFLIPSLDVLNMKMFQSDQN